MAANTIATVLSLVLLLTGHNQCDEEYTLYPMMWPTTGSVRGKMHKER